SSGGGEQVRRGCGGGVCVGEEGSVDDVGEASLEGSERFGLGLAVLGHAAFEVGLGVVVDAELGDGDAVDGGVELTVSGAGETELLPIAGPDRQVCGAVVAGVGVLALGPADIGGLGDDLGGGQRAGAGQGQQRGGKLGD